MAHVIFLREVLTLSDSVSNCFSVGRRLLRRRKKPIADTKYDARYPGAERSPIIPLGLPSGFSSR
ncbi:MAG: hypothetical protein ABSF71_28075 [Terriglobia bacterium]